VLRSRLTRTSALTRGDLDKKIPGHLTRQPGQLSHAHGIKARPVNVAASARQSNHPACKSPFRNATWLVCWNGLATPAWCAMRCEAMRQDPQQPRPHSFAQAEQSVVFLGDFPMQTTDYTSGNPSPRMPSCCSLFLSCRRSAYLR
jgi:hypothetical protein